MILQRLVEYYDRLADDPKDPMSPMGFSRESISFAVVIDPDGGNPVLADERDASGKKPVPRTLTVPDRGGRSGTALKPNFLWDNTGYVLGADSKGKPERSREAFGAFRDFHIQLSQAIDDAGLAAVVAFLSRWDPARGEKLEHFEEALDKNLAFRVRGKQGYVHDSKAVREGWTGHVGTQSSEKTGQSLVSGGVGPLARLHPLISGVANAQTMGAAIASFNLDAFTSYGQEQTYNAPVSEVDAFKYTTALNRLLDNRARRFGLGDATVVYWAGKYLSEEEAIGDLIIDIPPEDPRRAEQVRLFLDQLRQGHATGEAVDPVDKTPFYILGLSPNASRLSVRFWLDTTLGEFKARLAQHLADTALVGQRDDELPPIIRKFVNAAGRAKVRDGYLEGYDTGSVSPLLAGELARAVFSGVLYPQSLLAAMLNRLRADSQFRHERLAAIKAVLVRNHHLEIPVSLNTEHPSAAYQCGRLLCLLDYIQGQAIGNVNAGLVKKFYTAASSQPALIMGRLIALTTKAHLPKLDSDDRPGFSQFCEKRLIQIMDRIGDSFPSNLTPAKQGEFALGFYHQKNELPDTPPRYPVKTDRGEQVRSRAEAFVANALHAEAIDYKYELPLSVLGHGLMKPDFTVLGEIPADTVYIEYLGLMDNQKYVERWQEKLIAYRVAGILPEEEGAGPNGTLVTFSETKESGIDTGKIKAKVKSIFSNGKGK